MLLFTKKSNNCADDVPEERSMKLVTAAQIREIDRVAIEELGIPSTKLMSHAAEHIAKAAMEHIPPGGNAVAFCGTGKNGGDGIGAAAYLLDKGIPVRVFIVGDIDSISEDSKEMERRLESRGGSLEPFLLSYDLDNHLASCDVVIDAIFGTGLNSDLQGDALSAVTVMNSTNATVISADIPSGVHADTGAILGDAVKADITLTFSLAKPGHFVEPGCIYCGELRICDIGVPHEALSIIVSYMYAAAPGDIVLPRRRLDTHKGDYGRVLIIAGSTGYTGAPALAARATSKMGAGLVSVGVPRSIYSVLAVKLEEEMPFPLPDDKNGRVVGNAASEILKRVKTSDVCLIGPGLGTSEDISELVQSIVRLSNTPLVLDADGLNAIAGNIEILNQASCPLILTPHDREFQRLGGNLTSTGMFGYDRADDYNTFANAEPAVDIAGDNRISGRDIYREIPDSDYFEPDYYDEEAFDDYDIFDDNSYDEMMLSNSLSARAAASSENTAQNKPRRIKRNPTDRLGAARDFASKHGCILVLKGHRTIIALPNGVAYVNTTGGPAMAKGGTGDVLAGMIAALIAQKMPIVHAVASAVYIHGLAGDMCAAEFGDYCVAASDIITMLPKAVKEIEKA